MINFRGPPVLLSDNGRPEKSILRPGLTQTGP